MGKRSNFEKIDRNYYRTFDTRAGDALKPFLDKDGIKTYVEPFAGAGDLYDQLKNLGYDCKHLSDIEPQDTLGLGNIIKTMDYKDVVNEHDVDAMITNPPWDRHFFHEAIEIVTPKFPICWWLMSANWAFNKSSSKYLDKYVTDIVAIGRLKWIPDTKMAGKDDCIWVRTSVDKKDDTKFHNLRGL